MNVKLLLCLLALGAGCSSQSKTDRSADALTGETTLPPARPDPKAADAVVRVGSAVVTREQLTRPLLDEYGLNLALVLLRQELAEQRLREAGRGLNDEEVSAQRQRTLAQMMPEAKPEDYEDFLTQLLQKEGASNASFDIVVRTNAALRKLGEPIVDERLTPELLQQAFGVRYGEQASVRHMELANMQDVFEAQRRLAAGEEFGVVARAMSLNPQTARKDGRVPPFSRTSALPAAFVSAAFALKPGELSEPVMTGSRYELILLDEVIAPKIANFDDVKDTLREDLREEFLTAATGQFRREIDAQIRREARFTDEVLRSQYEKATQPQVTPAPPTQPAVPLIETGG